MGIPISQIQNANLRQMAVKVDNGDKNINHQELQEIISGVAKLQEARIKDLDTLSQKSKKIENAHDINESKIGLKTIGGFMGSFLVSLSNSRVVSKIGKAGMILAGIYGIGKAIYEGIKHNDDKEQIQNEKSALVDDPNLNSMAKEIKTLVMQMAKCKDNEDIAKYLATHDGGIGKDLIAANTWNNYVNAVYGSLREYPEDYDILVSEYIPTGRAETSLNKYDEEMLGLD